MSTVVKHGYYQNKKKNANDQMKILNMCKTNLKQKYTSRGTHVRNIVHDFCP